MAGVIGAIVETIISVTLLLLFGNVWVEYIVEILMNANVDLPDEVWDNLYDMLDSDAMGFQIMADFVFSLMISSLFGVLGGLLGYSIFKRQSQPPPQTQFPSGTGGQQM
jgi:hypothetical protein